MARATIPTLLPLDRWAELLGISPLHFSQLTSALGPSADCGDVWYQYAYQNTEFISREDVARAVRDAELKIAAELGYFVLPDWVIDERRQTVRLAGPELFSRTSVNVRGLVKSVETDWKYVISGGQRASTLITAATVVTFTDEDGDGYAETGTAAVTTTVTEPCEMRAFLPDRSGDFAYEIRPIEVSISGGVATITLKRWQMVDPDLQERLDAGDSGQELDGDTNAPYLTTIDVYRVFNDPQSQLNLLWERPPQGCNACSGTGCAVCAFDTQTGCMFVRDERLGIVGYRPASWDSDDEQFDRAAFVVGRDPEQLRLWYYCGWESRDPRISCPRVQMDPNWERAVVFLSIALLDRKFCSCNNVERFVDHWREDLSRVGSEVSHQVSPEDLANPFGPNRGAIYAWKEIHRNGRAIRR